MGDPTVKGTTWYWRQGIRRMPILSDACQTTELYTPVKNEKQAKDIITELQQQGITVNSKKTHSVYDVVPAGSLIVFAAVPQDTPLEEEKENMEKLKSYISAVGGKIDENPSRFSVVRNFMQNLFGRK